VARLRVRVCPRADAGIDVPGLHFTDVIRAGGDVQRGRGACVRAASAIFHFLTDRSATQVVVSRNINHPRLGAERDGRPVFPAPKRRAKVSLLAGARLSIRVDLGPAALRVEAPEDVLFDEGLTFDELDRTIGSFEEPKIAVARDVDQSFD